MLEIIAGKPVQTAHIELLWMRLTIYQTTLRYLYFLIPLVTKAEHDSVYSSLVRVTKGDKSDFLV